MKFEIIETQKDEKYLSINLDKNCLKEIKNKLDKDSKFEIEKDALNLNVTLYGKTKKESIAIQKKNCKQMLLLFKVCKKLIKMLKKSGITFDGKFYAKGLDKKKNNNDFMLCTMLEVKFNVKPINRLSESYTYAADYLDKENALNKMCDFHDNKCTKYRDLNKERTTGCCSQAVCRFTCNAPCPTWNLACKIIMCDYLIEKKGFYFTPHTIPIMRQHFSFLERCYSIGQLCRTKKKAMFGLWQMRVLGWLFFLGTIAFGTICCIVF